MKTRKTRQSQRLSQGFSQGLRPSQIPIVIISWNCLTFIKNLIDQLKNYPNPIIILDNKSSYKPLLDYYKEIKRELKDKLEIRLLKENHGSNVYLKVKGLPKVFILTDPDIELNENMPLDFAEILLKLSNKYKVYKVGLALDLKDKADFIRCGKEGNPLYEYQLRYWKDRIASDYELYRAPVDTTFCLINSKYKVEGNPTMPAIRIAGDFTARHLPWYKEILRTMPIDELNMFLEHNKSSTLVRKCITPMLGAMLGLAKGQKLDISDQNNIFS